MVAFINSALFINLALLNPDVMIFICTFKVC